MMKASLSLPIKEMGRKISKAVLSSAMKAFESLPLKIEGWGGALRDTQHSRKLRPFSRQSGAPTKVVRRAGLEPATWRM